MTPKEIVTVLSTLGVLCSTVPSESKPSDDTSKPINNHSDKIKSKPQS